LKILEGEIMKIAICLLAAALVISAASVKDQAVENQIKDNLDKFAAAAKAGDEKTLNVLLSDDLVYSHSTAKSQSKQEVVAALVKERKTFVHSDAQVRVYGNTAVVNVKIHMEPSKLDQTSLQVWVKKGSDWQMVARSATAVENTTGK
jgi:hypothetical protein